MGCDMGQSQVAIGYYIKRCSMDKPGNLCISVSSLLFVTREHYPKVFELSRPGALVQCISTCRMKRLAFLERRNISGFLVPVFILA